MSTTSNPDNNTSPGTHDIDFALESSPVPSVASLSLHSHDNQDMDVDSVITSIDSVSSTGTSLLARPMTFNEEAIAKQALDRERTLNDRCYQLRMQCILLDAELEKASPEQRPATLHWMVSSLSRTFLLVSNESLVLFITRPTTTITTRSGLRPTATRNLLARKSRLSESPLVPNSTVRNVAITTHMTRTGVKHVRNAAKKAMSHPNVAVEELLPEKTKANILIKVRVTPITVTKLTTRYSLNLTKSPLLTQNQ